MIVDAHTHIVPERFVAERVSVARQDRTFGALFGGAGGRLATAGDLVTSMSRAGVGRSVALGYGWTDRAIAREANDYILGAAESHAGAIIPFCSVNPAWGEDAVAEVERCAALGARGIGELHPDTQGFDITDAEALSPLMDAARRLDMVVLAHASEPVGHAYSGKGTVTPDRLESFLRNFPGNRIILAHFGGGLPFYGLMPEVREEFANAWFDTAAAPFLYDRAVYDTVRQAAGAGKLLFGSDFPLVSQERAIAHITGVEQPVECREALLGGTASALLGVV